MKTAQDTLNRIKQSFRDIAADLDGLENDLRHFHRKDERKRFDDLRHQVSLLRRRVEELSVVCETCP